MTHSVDVSFVNGEPVGRGTSRDVHLTYDNMKILGLKLALLATIGSEIRALSSHENRHLQRRAFLSTMTLVSTIGAADPAFATRAVGSGEIECREKGNCLEVGEWDGAVGWNWGAKDRCDATDPQCGADGRLRNGAIQGKPVPRSDNTEITHVVAIQIDVGREETGIIKLGLYGKDAPASVQQLIAFLSEQGFSTLDGKGNTVGKETGPVSLAKGGIVDQIVPGLSVDFGVPVQSVAWARSLGRAKVGESFIPQPRPNEKSVQGDVSPRTHNAAGLVSLSYKGLGYGGTGFESDDEAYESSFLITNDAIPSLDKTRRVVGQILDADSMAFLERLASIPTKRGIRGVIPGQTSGPPLLKTVVRQTQVAEVINGPSSNGN